MARTLNLTRIPWGDGAVARWHADDGVVEVYLIHYLYRADARDSAVCDSLRRWGVRVTPCAEGESPILWDGYEDMGETYHLKYEKLLQEHEELKAALESEAGTREMAQDDRDELVRENIMLRERIAELEQAQPAKPHEWESKTLRWFDHEVEGATLCKKESSPNFGCWFVKKPVTA